MELLEEVPSKRAMTENCDHECENLDTVTSLRLDAIYSFRVLTRPMIAFDDCTHAGDGVVDVLGRRLSGGTSVVPVVERGQRREI